MMTGTNQARRPRQAPRDYGWRFHGQRVGVLQDRSFTLYATPEATATALLRPYGNGTASLASCLQCGACTARCNLAEERHLFPRRQMTLLQLGQKEDLVADLSIWLCFNCAECSCTCPVNVRPGHIMAGIRQMAVEHYATPRFAAKLLNRAGYRPLAFLLSIVLLLALTLFGGSFTPRTSPVHFASMLPHRTLNVFFGAVAGLVLLSALLGATRAWKAFLGEALWTAGLRRFLRAAWAAAGEILTNRRAEECHQFPLSRWAHLSILYGFLTLLALSGVAAILILTGAPYPLPAWHPFKIAANLAAALVILGSLYFLGERQRASRKGDTSSWADWALLADLLLVGVTGVLTEIFRYANSARWAYPTYFAHLAFVFVLLAGLPYSKLAHVVYRGLALTAWQYQALAEGPQGPRRATL
jgi:quinone-modifying oxidoreductase subunit QmoC